MKSIVEVFMYLPFSNLNIFILVFVVNVIEYYSKCKSFRISLLSF